MTTDVSPYPLGLCAFLEGDKKRMMMTISYYLRRIIEEAKECGKSATSTLS